METDPRGQLGGLETTDAVRKSLAAESTSFKCPTCGRTNGEIIKECEERAEGAAGSSKEVEIPKELNMGWKDEMEAKKAEAAAQTNEDDAENAQLAEGFVQTAPSAVDTTLPSTSSEAPRGPSPAAASSTMPNLNPEIPRVAAAPISAVASTVHHRPPPAMAVQPQPQPQLQFQQPRRATDDGVPLWIDRTIVVLVVLLGALVLKILFTGG